MISFPTPQARQVASAIRVTKKFLASPRGRSRSKSPSNMSTYGAPAPGASPAGIES
mgnify:CR=1 FL=1